MLAHYAQGAAVSPRELLECARIVGFEPAELRSVMYELPYPQGGRARRVDPCPLSEREVQVLKSLAKGQVYKQIGAELAFHQHRADPSAQHLRQARRGRPRPGRARGYRTRLAVGGGRATAASGGCHTIGSQPMISITTKSPYALKSPYRAGGQERRRRPRADRRTGPPARRPGPVPGAALRRRCDAPAS